MSTRIPYLGIAAMAVIGFCLLLDHETLMTIAHSPIAETLGVVVFAISMIFITTAAFSKEGTRIEKFLNRIVGLGLPLLFFGGTAIRSGATGDMPLLIGTLLLAQAIGIGLSYATRP